MLTKRWRLFRSVLAIRMKTGLQYRVSALAGMSTQFFWGLMLIMIYSAFYSNTTNESITSLPRIIAYVWLQQAFLYAIALWWGLDNDITDLIRSGQIAYELARPQDLYVFWLAKLIGARVAGVMLRFPPVILFSFLLPEAYRFSPPVSVVAFLLFLTALVLGLCIAASYLLVAYMTLFYTLSSDGILWAFSVAAQFMAGQYIPVMFMPDSLQRVLYCLPFAYVNDFSFRIYMGEFDTAFALRGIVIQLVWVLLFTAAGRYMLNNAVRRTVVQGG